MSHERIEKHRIRCDMHGCLNVFRGDDDEEIVVVVAVAESRGWSFMGFDHRCPRHVAGVGHPTEHPCGDYPAPCNCDDPETHNGHGRTECERVESEPGYESEGASCVTHNCAWGECWTTASTEREPS